MTIYIPISKEVLVTFLVTNLIWFLIFSYKRLKIKFLKQVDNTPRFNNQGMYQSYQAVAPQQVQPSMYDQWKYNMAGQQFTPRQESEVKKNDKI